MRRSATTHFGREWIPVAEKQARVASVFHSVAQSYDCMNDAMSGGLHRLWKDELVAPLVRLPPTARVLDVAGGTGDIARRLAPHVKVLVADINASMLHVGKARAPGLAFVQANAEALPLAACRFDAYTIAFGLRNVTHRARALAEAHRVLRPGGVFRCLEFTPRLTVPQLQAAYDAYSYALVPRLGELLAGDAPSYQYLVDSIRRFPDMPALDAELQAAGFHCVSHTPLSLGVCAIHTAYKL